MLFELCLVCSVFREHVSLRRLYRLENDEISEFELAHVKYHQEFLTKCDKTHTPFTRKEKKVVK